MYEGREHKEAVSRMIGKPEEKKMQQFKCEDNRRNIPTQAVFQMYSIDERGFKLSDNSKYGTDGLSNRLFYSDSAPFPEPQELFENLDDQDGWHICRYKAEVFENDCGDFASALMSGNLDYMDEEKSKSLSDFHPIDRNKQLHTGIDVRESEVKEGENCNFLDLLTSKKDNKKYAWNKDAAPDIGKAYFAARTTKEYKGCPYHVAAVVATDGKDRITCEADASNEELGEPVFDMYSVTNEGQTFHDEQTSGYGNKYNPGITLLVGMDSPSDFEQKSKVTGMVSNSVNYEKSEQEKILKEMKKIGYILPNREDYKREREYKTLYLRLNPSPRRRICNPPV